MGQRCAREGCRAWAMRGDGHCRAHASRGEPAVGGRESLREWVEAGPGAASGELRDLLGAALARALEETGRGESLDGEIGALRVALARLLNDRELESSRLAEGVPRLVNATVRALRARRTLTGETAADLTGALTRALLELGLGE